MEPDVPCVPHLFVQRIDALPEEVLEGVLATLVPQTEERPGILQSLGWGKGTNPEVLNQSLDKSELRNILQRHRRAELPADADTADYSSEPYDSIPRQVQLQWRVYARLFPDEVAENQKLASMLPPTGGQAGPPGGADWRQQGVSGSASSTLFGVLPSVTALQQTIRNLVPPAKTSAPALTPTSVAPAAATAAQGAASGAAAASRQASATTAASASTSRLGLRTPTALACPAPELWRRPDPVFHKLSRSLDGWYELHREQARPLRRGHRARLLVVRGVDLPAEWKGSMRPVAAAATAAASAPGAAEEEPAGARRGWWASGGVLLRACAAAAGAMGLRRRPRVWEVVGAAAESDASIQTQRAQQQPQQQQQGKQEQLQRRDRASVQVARPRRGSSAADGGRGLVAAQAAARGMSFVLRKTTLLPPEWL